MAVDVRHLNIKTGKREGDVEDDCTYEYADAIGLGTGGGEKGLNGWHMRFCFYFGLAYAFVVNEGTIKYCVNAI